LCLAFIFSINFANTSVRYFPTFPEHPFQRVSIDNEKQQKRIETVVQHIYMMGDPEITGLYLYLFLLYIMI